MCHFNVFKWVATNANGELFRINVYVSVSHGKALEVGIVRKRSNTGKNTDRCIVLGSVHWRTRWRA